MKGQLHSRIPFIAVLVISQVCLIHGYLEIDRSYQELSRIPTDIPDTVTDLLLNHNLLSELPAGAFQTLDQLRYLNLEHNVLTSAVMDRDCLIGTVVSTLNLESNKLSTLLQLVQSHLTHLYMRYNFIRRIENASLGGLPSLQHLYFGLNEVSYIHPDAFCGTQLQTIGLNSNNITTVPDFHCLENTLTTIYLSGNKICIVENADFSELQVLRTLHLDQNCLNPILSLDVSLGRSLEALRLHSNSLEAFDIQWSYFRTLREVNLAENNFRCFHLVRGCEIE